MSTNKTEHYQLHLWEPEDNFLRDEFNENNSKIDTALDEHRAALAAVAASVGDLIVTGTYTGQVTGSSIETQTIELGFQPRFLIVRNTNYKGSTYSDDAWKPITLGFAIPGHGHYVFGSHEVVRIADTGFVVGGCNALFNDQNTTYSYLAVR